MSRSRKHRRKATARGRASWLPWLAVAVGLLVIGGAVFALGSDKSEADAPIVVNGAPRVSVVQEVFDYGEVALNTPIQTVFRVQNVGDQPLAILGTPQVELREGC